MGYSTAPTPLYPIYQAQRHFGVATITLVFAIYPLAVMGSVFLLGHVSDWIGRRRALVPALALEAASATAFALSSSLPVLLVARVLCGVGVGILTATASAYLSELDMHSGTGAPRRSDLIATAASLGGFGGGALISGTLASVAPDPLRLPFLVFLVVLVLAIAAATRLPETLTPSTEAAGYRLQRIAVPSPARGPFLAACAAGFAAMSLLSVFTALVPTLLTQTVHARAPILAGAVTSACCASAGLAPFALTSLDRLALLRASFVLLPAGITLAMLAILSSSFAMFLLGGTVGGLGSGALLRSALATVDDVAPPEARAETFAGFYLVVYFNGTAPIVGLGALTQALGSLAALSAYSAMVLVVLGTAAGSLLRAAAPLRLEVG